MVQQSRGRAPRVQHHLEGGEGQGRRQVRPERPPHDPPRVPIQHDRQVAPPLTRPDVGEIRDPHLIRGRDVELPPQPIHRHGQPVVAPGGDAEAPGLFGAQSVALHQARHPVPAAGVPPRHQLAMHPRAVCPVHRCVNPLHRGDQLPIALRAAALRTRCATRPAARSGPRRTRWSTSSESRGTSPRVFREERCRFPKKSRSADRTTSRHLSRWSSASSPRLPIAGRAHSRVDITWSPYRRTTWASRANTATGPAADPRSTGAWL